MGSWCTISDIVHLRPFSSFIFPSGVFLLTHHSFLRISIFPSHLSLFLLSTSSPSLFLSQSCLSFTHQPLSTPLSLSTTFTTMESHPLVFSLCISLCLRLSLSVAGAPSSTTIQPSSGRGLRFCP